MILVRPTNSDTCYTYVPSIQHGLNKLSATEDFSRARNLNFCVYLLVSNP